MFLAKFCYFMVPSAGSKVLCSCDPSNLEDTIERLVHDQIRVSIVGLSAQIRICQTIAEKTNGTYHVVMNETHYKELFSLHVPPPPILQTKPTQMIQMGFPVSKNFQKPGLCIWYIAVNIVTIRPSGKVMNAPSVNLPFAKYRVNVQFAR
jgi:hypothetical protein